MLPLPTTTEDTITTSPENNLTKVIEKFKKLWPVESWKKYGLFEEKYLYEINEHWLNFPPPNDANFYFLAVLYIVFLIVGLSGNALVVFMYFKCKSLQVPANALVASLAISDGCMMFLLFIFIFNSFTFGPSFGSLGCQIYGFWSGVTGTCSICILTAISVDRYFVIKEPLKYQLNRKRSKIYITVCWIYGAVFAALPLLDIGVGSYVPEAYLTSCSFDYLTKSKNVRVFIFFFFVAAWVVPFVIITFTYVNIYRIASNSQRLGKNFARGESIRHCKEEEKRRQEIKLAFTCFMAVILWFVSWTPYAVVALLGITDQAHLITPFVSEIPALFCKTASCLDPFVYAFSHPKFKAELMALICKEENTRVQRVWATARRYTEKRNELRQTASVDSRDDVEVFDVEVPATK